MLSRLYMGSTVDPSGANRANGWTVESLANQCVSPETKFQPGQCAFVYSRNKESSSSSGHQGLCISYEVMRVFL